MRVDYCFVGERDKAFDTDNEEMFIRYSYLGRVKVVVANVERHRPVRLNSDNGVERLNVDE